jgi:hypothetical protein
MPEHVSFFRARALPGKRQAILDHFEKWQREHMPGAKGFVRSIIVAGFNDPDDLMGGVRWDNTENYFANSDRPEQDAWYREFRALLASGPEWFDGTLILETPAPAAGAART